MKLSIIIPTYNSETVIGRALDSIEEQTFGDWEVLVMDGVSKDGTVDVVKSYNDNRIKFYSEPDKGIYDAMNKGIKKSLGEWLYFLGSDDYLYNNDVLSYFFEKNNYSVYDVVYGEVEASHLDERNQGEWSCANIGYNRCHQAIFYKRNIFERYGLYNLKYKVLADYDLNLKWFLDVEIISKYENKIVAHYSDGGYSSDKTDVLFLRDKVKLIFKKAYKKFDDKNFYLIVDHLAYYSKHQSDCIMYYFLSIVLLYYRVKRVLLKNKAL